MLKKLKQVTEPVNTIRNIQGTMSQSKNQNFLSKKKVRIKTGQHINPTQKKREKKK